MAGDLKQFLLEQNDNSRRYFTNIEAIMKKYDRNFENDEIINLTSCEVVKQIGEGNPFKSNTHSFGYSHLETTRRREQSFQQFSIIGDNSVELNSSGNVTINTVTSDASIFDERSLRDVLHAKHGQILEDDLESTISSFLEPSPQEPSDAETLSSFSGDSTGSDLSDNYLEYEHNDCVSGNKDDGQYSTASSSISDIELQKSQKSPVSGGVGREEDFDSEHKHCSIMRLSGFGSPKVRDKQKGGNMCKPVGSPLQYLGKGSPKVVHKHQLPSPGNKDRLKSPQIFPHTKLGMVENSQNRNCVESNFNLKNCSSERKVFKIGDTSNRNAGHGVKSKCNNSPEKNISLKSCFVDRKRTPKREKKDILHRSPGSLQSSLYEESLDGMNATYILSPSTDKRIDSNFGGIYKEDEGTPVTSCDESPNKASFISHPLKYTKWNGKHSNRSPMKRQYKSSQQSKLQRQQPVSPTWKYYCQKKLGSKPQQIIESPGSNEETCPDYGLSSSDVLNSRQLLLEDEPDNLSINTEDSKFKSNKADSSVVTECSAGNRSGSEDDLMLHSPENHTRNDSLSESVDEKVRSWLHSLRASTPFLDSYSSPNKKSLDAPSPWLKKTDTHFTNFGANIKTPPISKHCEDKKYTSSQTVSNGHINLKGKSLMEIFTKLKKSKTEMKSKRLSPKKDRRRSLPFIRAKRKLKLVSSKMSQKSSISVDDDEIGGVTCTKAILHNSETVGEDNPISQKVCIVSPRKRSSPVKLIIEEAEECSPNKYSVVSSQQQTIDIKKYLLTSPRGNEYSGSSLNRSKPSTDADPRTLDSTYLKQNISKISSPVLSPNHNILQTRTPEKRKNGGANTSFTQEHYEKVFDPKRTPTSRMKTVSSPQYFNRRLSCSPSLAMGMLQIRSPNSCSKSASKMNALLLSQCCDNEMQAPSEKTLASMSEHLFRKSEMYNNCHSSIVGGSGEKLHSSPKFLTVSTPAMHLPGRDINQQETKCTSRRQLEQQYSCRIEQQEGINCPRQKIKQVVSSQEKHINSDTFVIPTRVPSPSQQSDEKIPLLARDMHHTYDIADPHVSNTISLSSHTLQRYHNRQKIGVPPKGKMNRCSAELHADLVPKQQLKSIKESLFQKYAIKTSKSCVVTQNTENCQVQSTPQKFHPKLKFDETLSTICIVDNDSEEEIMTISPVRS